MIVLLAILAGAGASAPAVVVEARSIQQERLAEIRVQGNYRTPQEEVEQIAAIRIGDPIQEDTADVIRKRLEDSGRFDEVDVRKRWRSIESTDDVVLIILLKERPSGAAGVLGHLSRALGRPMFLPVLEYEDGYGFTYGARLSPPELLGPHAHVTVPLTWGATRQAALEITRSFEHAPVTYASASVSLREHDNPFYDVDDTRTIVSARVERSLTGWLRAGAAGSWTDITFGAIGQQFNTWGADIAVDTRKSTDLPRNALFVQLGWNRLNLPDGPDVDRFWTDARGYVGLVGGTLLALRAVRTDPSAPLPIYEQSLLGGARSVRGFPAGYDAGDVLVTGSAELRIPLTSPVSFGSAGATVFADTGAVYGDGTEMRDATFRTGVGGGVFFSAGFFSLSLDVARGLDHGYRVHFSTGVQF